MTNLDFLSKAARFVADYTNEHSDVTDAVEPVRPEDVYAVWFCKTLQNNKALFSTPRPDGMYYEVTYNGDKNEIYFDAYKRFENRCIKLGDAANS